ncbi:MAG: hypothetical protein IKN43_10145, partial [Selenomonadaceae bacterium]|nr:hypothetical protein [Selenomonadaceae bacterium]
MKAIINAKIIAPDLTGKFSVKDNGCILFDDKIRGIFYDDTLSQSLETSLPVEWRLKSDAQSASPERGGARRAEGFQEIEEVTDA